MLNPSLLWCAVLTFSLILLIVIRAVLTLSLAFSSLNALVSTLFGVDINISATVFVASFSLVAVVTALTNIIISVAKRKDLKIQKSQSDKTSV